MQSGYNTHPNVKIDSNGKIRSRFKVRRFLCCHHLSVSMVPSGMARVAACRTAVVSLTVEAFMVRRCINR